MFEMGKELPECDTDKQSEHVLLENGTDRFAMARFPQTFNSKQMQLL